MPQQPRLPKSIGVAALITSLAALLLFATGCGPETPRPAPSVTPAPSAIVQVTALASATTTAVPAPPSPTLTPQPSATPSVTSTPTQTPSPTITSTPTPTYTPTTVPTQVVLDAKWGRVGLAGQKLDALSVLPGGNNLVEVAGSKGVWSSSYDYTQWQPLPVKLSGQSIHVAIGSPAVMYVTGHTGCASGLPITDQRSTDGGKTWQNIPKLGATSIVATNAAEAYAITCSAVEKTTDAGATWTPLPGLKTESLDPVSLAVSPDGQTIYVALASEGGNGRVIRSTDDGKTAMDVSPKVAAGGEFLAPDNLIFVPGTEGKPQQGGLYMTSFEGVWFLPEEGNDWRLMSKPQSLGEDPSTYTWFPALFVDTAYTAEYNKPGPIIYTSRAKPGDKGQTNLGVYRSTDLGLTWTTLGTGLEGRAVTGLALAPHDPAAHPGMVETLLATTSDGVWALPLPPPFK